MPKIPPRRLTPDELNVLRFMLSPADRRLDVYRAQLEHTRVIGTCDCGCATIDLEVDGAGADPRAGGPITEARANSDTPPDRFCELLLFARGGWLRSLEIVSYGAEQIATFPPLATFEAPAVTSHLR